MQHQGITVIGDMKVKGHGRVTNTAGAAQPAPATPRPPGIDVLVITALKEEYDAARAVAGLSNWQEHGVGGSEPHVTATYRTATGDSLSVALVRTVGMGGRNVGALATTLVNKLRPTCLAMCGVCAGNPASTAPGDVVVAAPAYQWDEGKHGAAGFQGDHQQFPLDTRWVRAAQDFDPSRLPAHGVATDREAAVWFLERLHNGQSPRTHPARRRYFPPTTWSTRLEQLRDAGLIVRENAGWTLTDAGRTEIERTLYDDVDGPDRLPFEVFAGPMASGDSVVSVPLIWNHLEIAQRRILALEMEAATIATVADHRRVPHWLVAKGVMDHADFAKDDRFKAFAARASAQVLFALLGTMLTGDAETPPARPPAGRIPAPVKNEILRQLAYEWQDLAESVGVPSHEARRFRAGDEPREVWDWLERRGRLGGLPEALTEIGRADVAAVLRPYV